MMIEERPRWSPELMLPRMDMRNGISALFSEHYWKGWIKPMPEIRDIPENTTAHLFRKGSAAITWSGDVSPCIALMHSYQCYVLGREKFIKRYLVGNIAQERDRRYLERKNLPKLSRPSA